MNRRFIDYDLLLLKLGVVFSALGIDTASDNVHKAFHVFKKVSYKKNANRNATRNVKRNTKSQTKRNAERNTARNTTRNHRMNLATDNNEAPCSVSLPSYR